MWWPFKKKKVAAPEPVKSPENDKMRINAQELANIVSTPRQHQKYIPPKGVIPGEIESAILAMDSTPYDALNEAYMGYGDGTLDSFPGYPYLAAMAQRPEYRKMVGIIAEKMTSKWIEIKSVGDDDKSERVQKIINAMERFDVQGKFKEAAEHDGYFGGGQIYIDVVSPKNVSAWSDEKELSSKLFLSNKKIPKGSLRGFTVIEPVWTYPGMYNSQNPLSSDFYKPTQWFVMGRTVDASRMIDFVSRQVPDLLKPSYNFRGLSLTQIAEAYVNNWLRTRDSVSDMIHSYSIPVLGTNMQDTLAGGPVTPVLDRLDMFNRCRDNRGAFAINKTSDKEESLEFINAPLSGLDSLQAQAQEQMASVSGIPLVFLLGITPNGLNASSEGEIKVFYDYIHALQNAIFKHPLKRVIDIIQLSEFGDIDPDISFEFIPLYELNEKEKAEIRKIDAETDEIYVTSIQALTNNEVRQKIADDPDSPYHALEITDDIEIEDDEEDDEDEPDNTEKDVTDSAA